MLKWSQQFQDETPPYEDFSVTHVLCLECKLAHPDVFATEAVRHSEFLRRVFYSLFEARRRNDFSSAQRLAEEGIAANSRPAFATYCTAALIRSLRENRQVAVWSNRRRSWFRRCIDLDQAAWLSADVRCSYCPIC
jgi:hypothetical protein